MRNKPETKPDLQKEQAEGDRETIDQALGKTERTGATPAPQIPGHRQQGVTNRPREEEEDEQAKLPPRGEAKKPTPGGHA